MKWKEKRKFYLTFKNLFINRQNLYKIILLLLIAIFLPIAFPPIVKADTIDVTKREEIK